MSLLRPKPDEFPLYAADWVTAVPDGDIVDVLANQLTQTIALFRAVPESRGIFRYQANKWSVKDILRIAVIGVEPHTSLVLNATSTATTG